MRETCGNSAALRDALLAIRADAMSDYDIGADNLIAKCNAALAAPPRNCDLPEVAKGQPNLAEQAWRVFKRSHKDSHLDAYGLLLCIRWLLAPAKEGGEL